MATFTKRTGKRGTRHTARVRLRGQKATETFATKAAGEAWARAKEGAVETGTFRTPSSNGRLIYADAIDAFRADRKRIHRPPGSTFNNALERHKRDLGLEAVAAIDWTKFAKDRLAAGVRGSTIAGDLAYATSVLLHAAETDSSIDAKAPNRARAALRQAGVQVAHSRQRKRRISDAEIKRLLAWIDANAERTSLPLRDLVEFALVTGMRRGEILALEWTDINGRVASIKRKHPQERDRREEVPLLKPKRGSWPHVDPLAIINRQPRTGARVFPYLGDTLCFWFSVQRRRDRRRRIPSAAARMPVAARRPRFRSAPPRDGRRTS